VNTKDSAAATIDSIIYSDRAPDEMLSPLTPFIRLGDTIDAIRQRTGIRWHAVAPPGPVMQWMSSECGLRFEIAEPAQQWGVVNIHRIDRTIDGRIFHGCRIGSIELPSYYPFASLEEAEQEAKQFSAAWRKVRRPREPVLKRILKSILRQGS